MFKYKKLCFLLRKITFFYVAELLSTYVSEFFFTELIRLSAPKSLKACNDSSTYSHKLYQAKFVLKRWRTFA